MPPSALLISKIGPESDVLLRNLCEHYMHDMAEWFEIDTGADGRYAYDTSRLWESGCESYLAKVGDAIAGFAIVGSAVEWTGDIGAHDVHEFFVIRRFRRSGVGQRMAALVWNEYPGEWLVRVLEVNAPAVLFWRTAIARYSHGSYEEEGRVVNGRPWLFFRFVSGQALGDKPASDNADW
jgi:predicted acetyltransferase